MRSIRLSAAILAASLLALAGASRLSHAAGESPPPIRLTAAQADALGIEWAHPLATEPGVRSWPATVVAPPSQAQWIATPVAGLVSTVMVEANQRVAAGQPLAMVRSQEVALAAADWLRARSEASQAEREARRQRALVDEGVLAPARARQAESLAEQAQAELAAQRSRLQLYGMGQREISGLRAGAALPDTVALRAPAAGVVAELPVAAGQRVEAGAALARVIRTDRLALAIRVPAAQAQRMKPGTPVRDASGRRIGTLGAPPGAVSAAQTVELRARLQPGELPWLLGQSVEVQLESGEPGWRLPRSAVFRYGDGHWVLVEAGGQLRPVAVEPQAGDGEQQVVLGRLDAGMRVAHGNVAALKGAAMGIGAPAGEPAPDAQESVR
ncbi:MAG: efflux RND transporter periplasmic adaptor subunit [Gammaproteobacteria bacterium]